MLYRCNLDGHNNMMTKQYKSQDVTYLNLTEYFLHNNNNEKKKTISLPYYLMTYHLYQICNKLIIKCSTHYQYNHHIVNVSVLNVALYHYRIML